MQTLSPDVLKSALLDLIRSDRAFATFFLSELLQQANTLQQGEVPSQERPGEAKKKLHRIIPPYRQNIKKIHPASGFTTESIIGLRELFADAPPAEAIIATINK